METVNGCTVITPTVGAGVIHLGPSEMQGAYAAEIGVFPPGEPPPPVRLDPHTNETFYIGAGEGTFLLGDREVRLTAGGVVFVPRGVAHTVWNSGEDPIRGLIVISPGDAAHEFVPVESA